VASSSPDRQPHRYRDRRPLYAKSEPPVKTARPGSGRYRQKAHQRKPRKICSEYSDLRLKAKAATPPVAFPLPLTLSCPALPCRSHGSIRHFRVSDKTPAVKTRDIQAAFNGASSARPTAGNPISFNTRLNTTVLSFPGAVIPERLRTFPERLRTVRGTPVDLLLPASHYSRTASHYSRTASHYSRTASHYSRTASHYSRTASHYSSTACGYSEKPRIPGSDPFPAGGNRAVRPLFSLPLSRATRESMFDTACLASSPYFLGPKASAGLSG
jgi:hypothetical protein